LTAEADKVEVSEQASSSVKPWRWVVWFAFLLAWSAALLVPTSLILNMLGGGGEEAKPVHIRIIDHKYFGKSLHVAAYAFAAMLTGWLGLPRRGRWLLLLFWSLHAFGSEAGQYLLRDYTYRFGSLRDVGLDHIGLLIGVALTWRWWRG
jgi:hypothetical protein